MKEIFETISYFIPTVLLLGLLLVVIDLYLLLRKYLKLKIKYYSDKKQIFLKPIEKIQ